MLETIDSEQATPSVSQDQRMRKLSQSGELNEDNMLQIMKDIILVLTGRTTAKLENAKAQLEAEGHTVYLTTCDVSSRRDVHELCLLAANLGTIKTVIHAAGLSPVMADPDTIIMVNAVGTKKTRLSNI